MPSSAPRLRRQRPRLSAQSTATRIIHKTNITLEERCCNTLHRLASDGLADVRSARRDGYYSLPGFVRLVGSGCRGRLALRRRLTGGNARDQGESRLGARTVEERASRHVV
jgi:hypothetical protein